MTTITVKILQSNTNPITLPKYATEGSAAMDLYANEPMYILPNGVAMCGTGLFLEIPKNWRGVIDSRSGLASQGIFVANAPGKIDSDYRGEIRVLLYNSTSNTFFVNKGDRIAQFSIEPVYRVEFEEVKQLTTTVRGSGGFGHTGK